MARSYVLYSGNAVQEQFSIPFGYLDRDHVVVSVNNVVKAEVTDYIFQSATLIDFVVAPPTGVSNVNIARNTPTNTAVVDFVDGSTLLEQDLDDAALQALYASEETLDDLDVLSADALQLDPTDAFWDAESKRIQNLADPTASNHAVTRAFLDTALTQTGNLPTQAGNDNKFLRVVTGAAAWVTFLASHISDATAFGISLLQAASAASARTALDVPSNAEAILDTLVDAKGDLIAATGADAVARKAVGENRTILEADSAQADGLAWAARALGLKSMQVFTASGTWTRPTGIRKVLMLVQGAGGGGSGCTNAADHSGAAGGGGGCGEKLLDVSTIASSTITIGAGGTAGAAQDAGGQGGAGGASSWADGTNTITGNGGAGGAAAGGAPSGGVGGTATGGDINHTGQQGGSGRNVQAISSNPGGSSKLGFGAPGALANSVGTAATANSGGGGSGAYWANAGGAVAGGAGGSGIIVVYEYE